MRLALPLTVGVSVIVMAAVTACSSPPPPPPPAPDQDSIRAEQARRDSIAAAAARADSIRRAQEAQQRIERQARADSLAAIAAETAAVRDMLSRMVNFDFNRSNIRDGVDTEVLAQKIAILQANPNLRVEVVGHCDERGTDEYNLALGNRRAVSSRAFLTDRGIAETRITVRSRGEEQPLDSGHTEAAWERNRRAEFRIVGGGDTLVRPRN
jgi:peptidoglycan-associated lipoprotein